MPQSNREICTPNALERDYEMVAAIQNSVAPDELLDWLENCEIIEDASPQAKGIALSRYEWETIAEAWDAAQVSPKKIIADYSPLDDDLANEPGECND